MTSTCHRPPAPGPRLPAEPGVGPTLLPEPKPLTCPFISASFTSFPSDRAELAQKFASVSSA